MRQGAGKPIVAPGAIFLRHLHNQILQLLLDAGSTQGLALLGAIEFLGRQLAIPAQNGIRLGSLGDCF